ncbi:KH domain protein [Candidatus Bilamarchaeum dharawalense]|uniref:KH domain protein n=1 Tax=Candidatus Bilamarchaeum dharawalense TaxID=2885759 RepID=A0A5E4LM37_9ARCH|nr:KH domain protein [Candidatus Bilamarchaeum dharawalense]
MTEFVKIPIERIKVFVGKDGSTKKKLEKKCNVEFNIDSDGDVELIGDPADIFFARDIVKAIGRGFTPEEALRLLEHDYGLYIIPLKDYAHSEKAITRLKGRVIGEKGKIKYNIEEATDSLISIYGNTIAIIAKIDTMEYAKEAIGMLIDGARHTSVLGYLAKTKREIWEARLKGHN